MYDDFNSKNSKYAGRESRYFVAYTVVARMLSQFAFKNNKPWFQFSGLPYPSMVLQTATATMQKISCEI